MKRSGQKWSIESCRVCGKSHTGYSGKLDSENVEYVICENRRMNVEVSSLAEEHRWKRESTTKENT